LVRTAALTQLAFRTAALAWLETRKPYLSPRTIRDYTSYVETLSAFFSEMKLNEIGPDQLRAYQRMRMLRAGASIINHECSVLQQMLKRIGRWAEVVSDYQPLSLPKESPHRALTLAEEDRLLRVGQANPQWDVAYCAFVLSINTTAGPGEIRHIRLCDIDLEERCFRIQPEGAKNEGRIRVIPLNDSALSAIDYLLTRAKRLGCTDPEHYLLPFRVRRNRYDPTRPCRGWRTAHNQLCGAAGIQVSPYTFRHHAITRLLESPEVSDETAEAIAGHISERMKKRYSHTRLHVRRAAVEALERVGRKPPAVEK
jgi:integrase